jgi:hypothetical protein
MFLNEILLFVTQELATSVHVCVTRKRPMRIINEVSGVLRPSR